MKSFNEFNRDLFQEEGKERNLKGNSQKRHKQNQRLRNLHVEDYEDEEFETFERFKKH